MNVKRGLFRVWVVCSAMFVLAVALLGWNDVEREFKRAAFIRDSGEIRMVPLFCEDAKGTLNTDYQLEPGDLYADPKDRCWYKIDRLRELFDVFGEVSDEKLLEATYKATGATLKSAAPWDKVSGLVAFAVGVPLLILALGSAIYWALAGFSRTKLDA
ncbi:MAG: hypothetical protein QE284_18600 [Rhizobium sp.]|nr:hypothetical protein [Rhizobium sp.]